MACFGDTPFKVQYVCSTWARKIHRAPYAERMPPPTKIKATKVGCRNGLAETEEVMELIILQLYPAVHRNNYLNQAVASSPNKRTCM